MEVLLFIGLVVLAVTVADQRSRINRLDELVGRLMDRLDRFEAREEPAPRPAALVTTRRPAVTAAAPEPASGLVRVTGTAAAPLPAPSAPRRTMEAPKFAFSFEELVGGKLPIWVGGIALTFAAIFLVRYSIEQGLLGPAVRTVMAGLFGLLLLAASEAARRIARFAEDPRVGQALAGAGIASLYGTLYLAGELYLLMPPALTIALMAVVTAAALFLSYRHGPPTAIMGLVGGFAAPFFAEPSGSLTLLLVYLALLIAGLFAVAIQRGWLWLALAATGGGIVWSVGIIAADLAGVGAGLGLFIAALSIGATLVLPRAGGEGRIRLLPVIAGFLQLAILAPALDFGYVGWGLYFLLSAAALGLAWRDHRLMPANFAALGLVLILLGAAFLGDRPVAPWAALIATLLFAIPGHVFAFKPEGGRDWTALALIGGAGPLLVASVTRFDNLAPAQWAALFAIAALPSALLSWRARTGPPMPLFGGALSAAALAFIAVALWIDPPLSFAALLVVPLGLAAWARASDRRLAWGAFALAVLAALTAGPVLPYGEIVAASLTGVRTHFAELPRLGDAMLQLALPAIMLGGAAWLAVEKTARAGLAALAGAAALAWLYTLAKQPLAIADDAAFVRWGLVERIAITQALGWAGLALLWRGPAWLRGGGLALLALALFRLVWFDLLLLNPLIVAQSAAVFPIHLGLAALAAWLGAAMLPDCLALFARAAALALTLGAAAAAIRLAFQGPILDAPKVATSETYAYSAGLLALALIWLWRGIAGGARLLRLAGLLALTAASLKVFLIDAAALDGLLRVLSFLGLGVALIGIGWAYGRVLGRESMPQAG